MPRLRRRHFLQLAGASLGAIALNPLIHQGDRFNQAMAQTTGKKLALLVGINQYPGSIGSLGGCINDLRLQYKLLVHRYGFDPQNIVVVADENTTFNLPVKELISPPTRQAILDAFQTHLIAQAEPEDAVIFHYSGHGTYVNDPHPIVYPSGQDYLNFSTYDGFDNKDGALVPFDAKDGVGAGEANVILGSTIFLLSYALKTENVTLILDSCYSGGGVRGNLIYRATLDENTSPSQVERDFQEQLIQNLDLTRAKVQELRQAGIAKGVAMTAARATQTSAETMAVSNFRAGIFTYLLTRYLWQTNTARPVAESFINLARITQSEIDKFGGAQNPIYFAKPNSGLENRPPYLLQPQTNGADAVVSNIRADQVIEFWLGGMTPRALEGGDINSVFEVLDSSGNVAGEIAQEGRTGLLGYGKSQPAGLNVQPGMLMRELIRAIPQDIGVRVGLHESLGEEAGAARQFLESVNRVSVVDVNGSTDADYLLGRFDGAAQTEAQQQGIDGMADVQAIEANGVGLFTNGLEPIPSTFGSQYESVAIALEQRLTTRLRLLAAKKALKTILSTDSSDLSVEVAVSSNQRGGITAIQSQSLNDAGQALAQVAQMRIGEEMSIQITSQEPNRPLYVAVIAIERDGDMYVYHPSYWDAAEADAILEPGESVTIPKADDQFYLPIQGPAGYFEVLVIASSVQLRDTLRSLQRLSDRGPAGRGQLLLFTEEAERSRGEDDSALSIVGDILGDFDRNASAAPASRQQRNVNTTQLAAIPITIEVSDANMSTAGSSCSERTNDGKVAPYTSIALKRCL